MQDSVIMGSVAAFDAVSADKPQALKVLEEAAEVFGAWQSWDACECAEVEEELWCDLMGECADVVQAVANLVKALGCSDMRLFLTDCEDRNRERGRITGSKPYPRANGREGCKRFVFVPVPVGDGKPDSLERIFSDASMPPASYLSSVAGVDAEGMDFEQMISVMCRHIAARTRALVGDGDE